MRVAHAADDRLAVGARAGAVERIRHLAAAFDHAEDLGAARLGVVEAFEHQRAGAFRHHEAVAVLGERLGRCLRRIVRGRQRRQQREADQRLRIDRAVGADAQRGLGFAAPDRLDAELDRGRARGAGGRQRDRRALGAEAVGQMLGDRAASGSAREAARNFGPTRRAQEIVVVDGVVAAGRGGERFAMRPFDLDRRHRQEQRPREIALAADAGFARSLPRPRCRRAARRASVGAERLDRHEVDRAGDGGLQAVGRKAADACGCRTCRRSASPSCRPCRCRAR